MEGDAERSQTLPLFFLIPTSLYTASLCLKKDLVSNPISQSRLTDFYLLHLLNALVISEHKPLFD